MLAPIPPSIHPACKLLARPFAYPEGDQIFHLRFASVFGGNMKVAACQLDPRRISFVHFQAILAAKIAMGCSTGIKSG